MKNKLLCTFVKRQQLHNVLYKIKQKYPVLIKVIVLFDEQHKYKIYCLYNIDDNVIEQHGILEKTILVNRKRQTNTIYTINALNKLIEQQNGILDSNYNID